MLVRLPFLLSPPGSRRLAPAPCPLSAVTQGLRGLGKAPEVVDGGRTPDFCRPCPDPHLLSRCPKPGRGAGGGVPGSVPAGWCPAQREPRRLFCSPGSAGVFGRGRPATKQAHTACGLAGVGLLEEPCPQRRLSHPRLSEAGKSSLHPRVLTVVTAGPELGPLRGPAAHAGVGLLRRLGGGFGGGAAWPRCPGLPASAGRGSSHTLRGVDSGSWGPGEAEVHGSVGSPLTPGKTRI